MSLANPIAALKLGIATIYQELDLVDGLSVADNIHLGHENATGGFVHRRDAGRERPAGCSPGSATPRSRPTARSAGCPPPRSRWSAWRAPSPRTPG